MEIAERGTSGQPVISLREVIAAVQRLRRLWATAVLGLYLATGGAALLVDLGVTETGSPALISSWIAVVVAGAAGLAWLRRPIVRGIAEAVVRDPVNGATGPAKQAARAWRTEHRAPLFYGCCAYSVVAIPGGMLAPGNDLPVALQVAGLLTTGAVYHLVAVSQARGATLTAA